MADFVWFALVLGVLAAHLCLRWHRIFSLNVLALLILFGSFVLRPILFVAGAISREVYLEALLGIFLSCVLAFTVFWFGFWRAGDAKLFVSLIAISPGAIGALLAVLANVAAVMGVVVFIRYFDKSRKKAAFRVFSPRSLIFSGVATFGLLWLLALPIPLPRSLVVLFVVIGALVAARLRYGKWAFVALAIARLVLDPLRGSPEAWWGFLAVFVALLVVRFLIGFVGAPRSDRPGLVQSPSPLTPVSINQSAVERFSFLGTERQRLVLTPYLFVGAVLASIGYSVLSIVWGALI